jgi:hypothetical protein
MGPVTDPRRPFEKDRSLPRAGVGVSMPTRRYRYTLAANFCHSDNLVLELQRIVLL